MKQAIVIPVLLFSFLSALAQQQPKTLLEIVKENKAGKIKQSVLITDKIRSSAPMAKLHATTSKGKIYALPLDNMPVLVTDKSETALMPNAAPFGITGNTIPNARPVQTIIPSKLSLKPIAIPKLPLLKHQRSQCGNSISCTAPAI